MRYIQEIRKYGIVNFEKLSSHSDIITHTVLPSVQILLHIAIISIFQKQQLLQ